MDHCDKIQREKDPREKANLLSLATFSYTAKLFAKAFKKDLEEDDIYEVVKSCRSKQCGDRLEEHFQIEKRKGSSSIFKLLWSVYGTTYLILGFVHLTWSLINSILEPEAIGKLVAYFTPNQTKLTLQDATYYAGIMVGLKLLRCFYFHNYLILLQQLAIQIRTAFCSLIYRKALKLTPEALSRISLGNIVTIVTKDVLQFESSIWLFNDLWIAIVQTIVMCYLIYSKIGVASTVGVGMLLAIVPVQMYVGKIIKNIRLKINQKTDDRLQISQETLSAIKIIKMYTWLTFFGKKIDEARKKEMKMMMKNFFLKIVIILCSSLCSKIGFYALIMTYIWINHNDVSAELMFYVMKCFGTLRHTIAFSLSFGMTRIAELSASLNRIKKVLVASELTEAFEKPTDNPRVELKNISVTIKDKEILKNVSLCFKNGLNIITGQLGCGKSSLIKVILEDYPLEGGLLKTKGRKSYASQDPWLFPSSIKQNILFGEKLDNERYQKVVKVCSLEYDFSLFEKGDETIVADRGLNLSKGQQARINLARAVYKDSDIYLLDDSLTALDPHVQDAIFNDCINGFLKDKLCVLVTHNAKHIEKADKVVVLERGKVKFEGEEKEVSRDLLAAIEEEEHYEKEINNEEEPKIIDEKVRLLKDADPIKKKRVYHEIKQQGSVNIKVYFKYFKYGGGFILPVVILLLYFGSQFTESYSSKLLTNWINLRQDLISVKNVNFTLKNASQTVKGLYYDSTNKTVKNNSSPANISLVLEVVLEKLNIKAGKTLNFYSITMIACTILELFKHYLILQFARKASVNLHKNMINSIIFSVMSFFDTYFIGNILNRFSQDLSIVDEILPFVLDMLIGTVFSMGGVIILIATINWRFLIPSLAFLLFLIILRYLYMPTARSLKRLESATRSPLVGHLNASMEGLTTIRAYRAQEILKNEFDRHQDVYTSAHFTSFYTKRAFAFYMDFSSVVFLSCIVGRFLLFDVDTAAGDVGLAITQASMLSMIVQWGLMQWAEIENIMTSVERVLEYTDLEQENLSGLEIKHWPDKGEINYVNVSLTYANSLERVLKNVSFTVKAKQKIGIVGRTGAGKSSIISTLFRLYKFEGQIFIDDVEIKTLSLEFLRQSISIIPQDPILFAGTIRSNIDPLEKYSDERIWKVINKIKLDKIITSLDYEIKDGTTTYSTGQRQLICLARAIIKKNKIVVLDEATANMDPETEFLIQKAIVENFSACTVFIIAHRLQSILDCHKVMVMDKGEIVELEDPLILMEDKTSMFSKMLKNAGLDIKDKTV